MWWLILVVLTLLTVYLINVLTKNLYYWEKKNVKHVKPLPFFGNMLPVVTKSKSLSDFIKDIYDKYSNERYIGIYQFTTPILFLQDPELIKNVTIKYFENFVDHAGFINPEADPLWGKNLFSSQGDRWRDLRQTISPVFTSSKMKMMFVLMDECARQLRDYFKSQNKDVVEIELKDVTTRYTNDVIASTAFGIRCNSLENKENEFLLAGRKLSDFSGLKRFKFILYGNFPKIAKYLNLKMIDTRVGNFFRSVISETIKTREEKNIVRPDLIHLLILSRKGKLKYEDVMNLPDAGYAAVQESEIGKASKTGLFLSDEDITAQALVFFLGGFDTVSTVMSFTGYELAVNPHVQKRLKEEIQQTLQECDGKITYERLLQMRYLDMVVCEVLRKWSQAIWIDRKCTKAFEIKPEKPGESKVTINVGDICWIPIYGIHRDPKYYPDPDLFDPERFSDENKDNIPAGAYIPFGAGPRNCIGSRFALLEIKIVFFYLLSQFDIVPTEKTQIPLRLSKNHAFLTAENGFNVGLKRSN